MATAVNLTPIEAGKGQGITFAPDYNIQGASKLDKGGVLKYLAEDIDYLRGATTGLQGLAGYDSSLGWAQNVNRLKSTLAPDIQMLQSADPNNLNSQQIDAAVRLAKLYYGDANNIEQNLRTYLGGGTLGSQYTVNDQGVFQSQANRDSEAAIQAGVASGGLTADPNSPGLYQKTNSAAQVLAQGDATMEKLIAAGATPEQARQVLGGIMNQPQVPTGINLDLPYGTSGQGVADLQNWLISQGYDIPAIQNGSAQPGYYGEQTLAALNQWRIDNGGRGPGQETPSPGMGGAENGPIRTSYSGTPTGSLNIPNTVPSTAISGGTSTNSLMNKVNTFFDIYTDAQKKINTLYDQINATNTGALQQKVGIEGQTISTPIIGGQVDALKNAVAYQMMPLENRLDSLVRSQGNAKDALSLAMDLQKMSKPDVLGTQVNSETGDVYAFVQDANGGVSTQTIGNVGAKKGKEYVSTGTYTNGSGQNVFFGVDSSGKITQQVLGTAKAATTGTTEKKETQVLTGILEGFIKGNELTPSDRVEAKAKLNEQGFNSSTAPEWYKAYVASQGQGTPGPALLNSQWNVYRNNILDGFVEEDDFNFESI